MRRLYWWCLLALLAGLLMGCEVRAKATSSPAPDGTFPGDYTRFVDTTYKVVCYTSDFKATISCVSYSLP